MNGLDWFYRQLLKMPMWALVTMLALAVVAALAALRLVLS